MQDDELIKKSIGAKLKAKRKSKGFTQNYIAESINMDEKQLSRLEAGKHYPTLKTLLSLIHILDMELADFDETRKIYDKNYYSLIDILKTSTPKELKQFLIIINAIKELEKI